jgi:hypothetical protein
MWNDLSISTKLSFKNKKYQIILLLSNLDNSLTEIFDIPNKSLLTSCSFTPRRSRNVRISD